MPYDRVACFNLPPSFLILTSFRVPPLLFSIMSTVSNSALGMGGSDFEGSIRQPLVEQEVVPIGDSSSKDVPHKVSNNESSSF